MVQMQKGGVQEVYLHSMQRKSKAADLNSRSHLTSGPGAVRALGRVWRAHGKGQLPLVVFSFVA